MILNQSTSYTIFDEAKPLVVQIDQVRNQTRQTIWRHILPFEPDICGPNDSNANKKKQFKCRNIPDQKDEQEVFGDTNIVVTLDITYKPNSAS